MIKVKLILVLMIINTSFLCAQIHSYFSEESLDCIVLLEKKIDSVFVPHGTGFLLYDYTAKNSYFVVTCAHILKNPDIYVCVPVDTAFAIEMRNNNQTQINFLNQVWTLSDNKLRTQYYLIPNKTFIVDKSLDIGIFPISIFNTAFKNDTVAIKVAKIKGVPRSGIKQKFEIPLGTDVYFTGFPLMIGTDYGLFIGGATHLFSDNIPNPLVRKGSVAWKSENNNEFLLDAFSYGGNSGSPIFTISDLQNRSYLIGMVLGHLPSESSENIGLARCIWMDNILKLVNKFNETR